MIANLEPGNDLCTGSAHLDEHGSVFLLQVEMTDIETRPVQITGDRR